MGLGKLFRAAPASPAENRSVPSGGIQYVATDIETGGDLGTYTVWGGIAPDWPTASSYRSGMNVPGAWRGALLISGLLAGVPWYAYRKPTGVDPAPQLVVPTPALLDQPSPPETRFTTFRSLALDYIWEGNALAVIAARGRDGWPTAVVPVPASMVGVRRVDERNYPIPMGEIEYNIGGLSFTPNEVLHFKGPCEPGALRGMGVLESQMSTIRGAQQLNADAHAIKGVPTGVLKSENPDLTPKEARDMKTGWLRNQRERTVAVLNASTSFEPLSWNPQEAQLIEARQFSLSEMELIFGLPVGWLGGKTSSRTYSNIEQDAINLLKFSLNDHLEQWKQTWSLAFPRTTFVAPDLDSILESDTMTRFQAYAIATGGEPWMLPSEVRAREKLKAIPGIDDKPEPPAPAAPPAGTPPTDEESS